MGKRRNRTPSLETLTPELADPLRNLHAELALLKKPATRERNQEVVVARLLDALRQLGEALSPLSRTEIEVPRAPNGPVLAFRRGAPEDGNGRSEPRGPRVLVVEPEPSVNEYIENVLDRAGFAVLSIPRIEAAVERARLEPPDVVTIDQLVLRHDGEKNWLVRFKTEPALARVPIVLVRSPEDEEPAHPFGITAMVTKPIDPDELSRVLRQVTGDARPPSEPEASGDPIPPPVPRVVRG
jgi:CheY-like chemotaxis protein